MAKDVPTLFDFAAESAGIDLKAARADMAVLDNQFAGQHGRIPAGALQGFVNKHFAGHTAEFFLAVARAMEDEHAATLTGERKLERELSGEEWIKRRDAKAKAAV